MLLQKASLNPRQIQISLLYGHVTAAPPDLALPWAVMSHLCLSSQMGPPSSSLRPQSHSRHSVFDKSIAEEECIVDFFFFFEFAFSDELSKTGTLFILPLRSRSQLDRHKRG